MKPTKILTFGVKRHKLEGFDVDNIEEFEDLEDDERDALENILSDPKKVQIIYNC
jgi:hypothetical protein